MRYVRTRHVAGDQHRIRIMRADGWIEHGPPATRTKDAEVTRPLCCSDGQARQDENCRQESEFHRCLAEEMPHVASATLIDDGLSTLKNRKRAAIAMQIRGLAADVPY